MPTARLNAASCSVSPMTASGAMVKWVKVAGKNWYFMAFHQRKDWDLISSSLEDSIRIEDLGMDQYLLHHF